MRLYLLATLSVGAFAAATAYVYGHDVTLLYQHVLNALDNALQAR